MTVGKAATSVGALLHAAHRSCCGRITGGQHVWPAWASRSLGSSRMPVQNYYCQYTHRNRLLSPSSSSSAPSSVRDAATLFKVGVGDRAALRSAAAALLGLPPRRSYMDDGRGRTNDDYRDEVLCWVSARGLSISIFSLRCFVLCLVLFLFPLLFYTFLRSLCFWSSCFLRPRLAQQPMLIAPCYA